MNAFATFAAVLAVLTGLPALAQQYPTKPVRIVVAYSPGTGIDILAREVGQQMSQRLAQPFVIENRPGASGNLGVDLVAKSPPDGYTLAVVVNTVAINPSLYKLPYDPVNDFAPVGMVARGGMALVVHPSVSAANTRELVQRAKQNPGKINYASPGIGSPQHLAMELFKYAAGIDMLHIPHKGSAEAVTAMLAGHTDIMFMPVHTTLPHVKSGKLRVLSVASLARQPLLPDAPTVVESAAIPGFDVDLWYAMLAPAKTPREVTEKLNAELHQILNVPTVRDKLSGQGLQATPSTPEQYSALLRSDIDKWAKVIKAAGIRAE
jgi:tripartite-type tricarboxylate transporter receptor subunit TctC